MFLFVNLGLLDEIPDEQEKHSKQISSVMYFLYIQRQHSKIRDNAYHLRIIDSKYY